METPVLVPADVAFMLVATALVLLMTPALAFFYGGLVRSKNSLNAMMMSFTALGFVGVAWALVGYSLAFSAGSPFVGGLSRAFLNGVGLEAQGTIPHLLFMAYQGTFAIITAALISGAIVERMRAGDTLIPDMVKVIYKDVDKRLHPAAAHSVLAHVIQLVEEGRAVADGPLVLSTHYRLAA